MAFNEERRFHPRLSTGEGYSLRFRVGEREVSEARLQNLSAGGCGFQVAMADAQDISPGSSLQALYLDHPDLPYVPLEASVVRIMGKVPGKQNGYALVGAEFTRITPLVMDLIHGHLVSELRG